MVNDDIGFLGRVEDWERGSLTETYRFVKADSITALRTLTSYRLAYEAEHGSTPDRVYVTQLSRSLQEAIYKESANFFFRNLPPFAQKFFAERCRQHARLGNLDDMGNPFVELFVRNRGRGLI